MSVINTHSFGRFWPVSWTITQFWGPEVISTTDEPKGAFTCRLSTLTIWANSGSFHALLLTGLGPRGISMIDDPRSAFTCPSSTLTVLANSDPFRGLLLTVLGSRSDFHDRRTPGCVYVSVINTHSFGRLCPVSWTITHCFGVPEGFPRLTNPGMRLRVVHQQS